MSLGRYSVKDWKGYVAMPQGEGIEAPKLENYIQGYLPPLSQGCRSPRRVWASNFGVRLPGETREGILVAPGTLSGPPADLSVRYADVPV